VFCNLLPPPSNENIVARLVVLEGLGSNRHFSGDHILPSDDRVGSADVGG